MIIVNKKYYGEIWFQEQEQNRCFCVLAMVNQEIHLETNLFSLEKHYKEEQILGEFTGLGHATFIDCRIKQSMSGIIEMRVYGPRYTFISAHHKVDIGSLSLKKFQVNNNSIVDWVNHMMWYNTYDNNIIKKDDIKQTIDIRDIGLKITINHNYNYKANRGELKISGNGFVSFDLHSSISILKAIEIYLDFLKILQFLSQGTKQYNSFRFQCLGCSEWIDFYHKDTKGVGSNNSYITIPYEELIEDLPKIVQAQFSNSKFHFCLDKLMENYLSPQGSHSRRFVNSISAFEAFGKLYAGLDTYSLKGLLKHYQELFILIGKIDTKEFNAFATKVIRSRNYHVHSNIKDKNIFSDFELLYVSLLIDYIIGYGLLSVIEVSSTIKEKIVLQGQSIYINMQRTNQIFSSDSLKSSANKQ